MIFQPSSILASMKKAVLFGLVVLSLLSFAACAQQGEELRLFTTPTPSPTPSPSPTPVPSVALVNGGSDEAFTEGARRVVTKAGLSLISVECAPGDLSAVSSISTPGACALIVRVTDDMDDLSALSAYADPVLLYRAGERELPQGMAAVLPETEGSTEELLKAAVAYPGYIAPVRMIGLFTDRDSKAYTIWKQAVAEGRIMSKATRFYDGNEENAKDFSEWLAARLKEFYPGMIDCIFAQTGALAVQASDVVAGAGRGELEIFAAGLDGELQKTMRERPTILVAAAGIDSEKAGEACARRALELLEGGSAAVTTLEAEIYTAAQMQP